MKFKTELIERKMEPIPVIYYDEGNYDENNVIEVNASVSDYQVRTSKVETTSLATVLTTSGSEDQISTSSVDFSPSTSPSVPFSTSVVQDGKNGSAIPVTQEGGNGFVKGMH